MTLTKMIKNLVIHNLALTVAFFVRRVPSYRAKRVLIENVFNPYFSWRKIKVKSSTSFGSRMHLSLPDSIQTRIFLTGCWEPHITSIVSKSLDEGDIFIDVGANVGYYTLLASKLVGDAGKVYAFEASPNIFADLRKNVAANRMHNINLFNVAVSKGPGIVTIWAAPEGNLGHATIIASVAVADGHYREAEVPCDALGSFVPYPDLLAARLVKIDIEGAERMAIEGIISHLNQFSDRTEWLIELSPEFSPEGLVDTDWVFQSFIDAGYFAYLIDNSYSDYFSNLSRIKVSQLVPMTEPPRGRLNDLLFSKALERR